MKQIKQIFLKGESPTLRNYWSKMKELNHVALGKDLSASVKAHLFFTKGYSDNLEKQVEVEPS